MNQLQLFNNPEFGNIRVVEINGEPWFVGSDVATALGYANPRDALKKHVDDEDKDVANCDTLGGTQAMTVINESGLYSLILRSNIEKAKEFKRWITAEVIPSIRKTGMYINSQAIVAGTVTGDMIIALGTRMKELETKNAVLKTQVAELQPKASYCDSILQCKELVTTTKIAKDYGFSGRAFNRLLHELGVQFKQGDIWLLYQKYSSLGWTQTKSHIYIDKSGQEHCRVHTYWTQKGRLGLYKLLKDNGYLPLIEQ